MRRLYSTTEMAEVLGLPPERITSWIGSKLLNPTRSDDDGAYFDFPQLSAAKTLRDLSESGLTDRQLRRHMARLQRPDDRTQFFVWPQSFMDHYDIRVV